MKLRFLALLQKKKVTLSSLFTIAKVMAKVFLTILFFSQVRINTALIVCSQSKYVCFYPRRPSPFLIKKKENRVYTSALNNGSVWKVLQKKKKIKK